MVTHGGLHARPDAHHRGSGRRGIPASRRLGRLEDHQLHLPALYTPRPGNRPHLQACALGADPPGPCSTRRPAAGRSRWSRGANSSARISPMAIWWMWCRPSIHTCWSITANSLSGRETSQNLRELEWCVVRAGCECRAPSESEESSNVQYLPMAIAWRRQDAGARRGSRAR